MTETPKTLWEDSTYFREEDGPGMPDGLADGILYGDIWRMAGALLRDRGMTYLITQGLMPAPDLEGEEYIVWFGSSNDKRYCKGRTLLAAINAAIGAHLTAKKKAEKMSTGRQSEQATLKVNGKSFRCICRCDVFTKKPDPKKSKHAPSDGFVYTCNACGERYRGA